MGQVVGINKRGEKQRLILKRKPSDVVHDNIVSTMDGERKTDAEVTGGGPPCGGEGGKRESEETKNGTLSYNDDTEEGRSGCAAVLCDNLLIVLTMVGVMAGFAIGFGIRPLYPSEDAMEWIGLPGEMYMRMLTFTILPLVVSSVISGTSSLDPKSNGRISAVTLAYIVGNNVFGVLLGVAMYFIVKPGDGVVVETRPSTDHGVKLQTQDLFLDLIRNLFPDNIVTACFQTVRAERDPEWRLDTEDPGTYVPTLPDRAFWVFNVLSALCISLIHGVGRHHIFLGLIIISTLIGMATSQVGEVGRPFVNFFRALSEVIIKVLRWIVWFTPFGVASLIASSVAAVEDISGTFQSLAMLILAVALCNILLIVVIFPALYFILVRRSPVRFLFLSLRPLMTAFAPPSSAVAMPDMMYVCENKFNVDVRISRFCIPLSDTLDRVGSCTFIYISAIFLCKLENLDLEVSRYILIAILTAVSSFAIPSVPSSSIISIIIILSSVNIETRNVGLLLALEWLLDRLRTCANTMSIITGAVFTNRLCQDVLKKDTAKSSTSVEVNISETQIK